MNILRTITRKPFEKVSITLPEIPPNCPTDDLDEILYALCKAKVAQGHTVTEAYHETYKKLVAFTIVLA